MNRLDKQQLGECGVIYESGTTALTGLDVCKITTLRDTVFSALTNALTAEVIPTRLIISGITDPTGNNSIIVSRSDGGVGRPIWQNGSGIGWNLQYSDNAWSLSDGDGIFYAATKESTADTPVGLTGWTLANGAGQPTIAVYNPSPTGITIPAGVDLYGKFTAVTLSSGAVALYKSDKL